MDRNRQPHYPYNGLEDSYQVQDHTDIAPLSQPNPAHSAYPHPYTSDIPNQPLTSSYSQDTRTAKNYEKSHPKDSVVSRVLKIDKKWQRRLYWIIPLAILIIVLCVLFEVYKSDFERWVSPLSNWLREREAWSWVIPVVILIVLSFPPLFGHEIVQLVVGLTYPLGVAIGIACAGAILGEAICFIVFKYAFTSWVDKKIATKVQWAAIARISQQAGFRGVLIIRYSIVPPHIANPLFSCTGMKFWLYMVTVILSLPKSIVFVLLGTPSSENSRGAKYGKVVAVLILVVVTIFACLWIRTRLKIATEEIEAERAISQGAEDVEISRLHDDTHAEYVKHGLPEGTLQRRSSYQTATAAEQSH